MGSRLAKATYRGLLLEEVDDRIADRGGIVLIYAMGREVMHELHPCLVASLDCTLDVAHGLKGWGVA